jgi:hypothetical protein
MKNSTINKIKTLLGMEVSLMQMKLMDGVTIFEADAFEMDNEVFIITEDEQKIPVPIGEYELEDGMILVVAVEGIIAEIKEAVVEEPEAPEAEVEVEVEATEEAPKTIKKTIESQVKETFFSEIEKLQAENIELKAKLELLSKVEVVAEEEATELSEVKPISFNPENTNEVEHFQYGAKRPRSVMDSILEKISK